MSAVWAERVGLAFCHVFLCSVYMRRFPQPRRPAEHPPFPLSPDCPGLWQLYEQQQAWGSLWFPAPKSGCGEGHEEGFPGLGDGDGERLVACG